MITNSYYQNIISKLDKIDKEQLKNLFIDLTNEYENILSIFNSLIEGVLVLDNKNNILGYNKVCLRLYNINSITPGQKIDEIIKDKKLLTEILKMIKSNERIINREIKLNNDLNQYYSLSIYPLVKDKKIAGNILITEDISEKKEIEKMNKQIESFQALSVLTSGLAHEIKNPLGAISIHIQLINQELSKCKCSHSEDLRYSLNIVNEEIDRLNDIVVNFLYSIRPLKAELIETDMNEFLENFINFIKPELDSKNIKLTKDYKDIPALNIDINLFKQALLNLVQNSIAALKGIKNPEIIFHVRSDKNYVYISVIDNGCGIPEDIQTKIFDPYFTTKSNGNGLGLTIVYKIVKEHNGEIKFKSEVNKTIFTIKLPKIDAERNLIEYNELVT